MKRAVYFEDLQKDVFVIKVIDGSGKSYLEQRKWYQNDYSYTPDDEFDRVRKEGLLDSAGKYGWIDERSELMAVAEETDKWTDREWVKAA